MENEKTIFITDEDGNEKSYEILLTFDFKEKKYMIVTDPLNDEDAFAFSYDDEGNLYPVDDEEELAMVAEVLSACEDEDDE